MEMIMLKNVLVFLGSAAFFFALITMWEVQQTLPA